MEMIMEYLNKEIRYSEFDDRELEISEFEIEEISEWEWKELEKEITKEATKIRKYKI